MLRSFLLASCLLICVSCATPFRLAIEEGMTQDEVRALAGEPQLTWVPDIAGKPPTPGVIEEAWEYQLWFSSIALYFEDAKLIRWTSLSGGNSSGGVSFDSFNSMDWNHHSKGHKHHHGHGC